MDGDFYNMYVEKLLLEIFEISKQKVEILTRAALLEKKLTITTKDLENIAIKYNHLESENSQLREIIQNYESTSQLKSKKHTK